MDRFEVLADRAKEATERLLAAIEEGRDGSDPMALKERELMSRLRQAVAAARRLALFHKKSSMHRREWRKRVEEARRRRGIED